ncbi:ribosome biogenesis/translation initiation ATPase RLI, partial [archaeon]|nr:ribosome biogenesis/translation initiation ATPase RLI [archaeon]
AKIIRELAATGKSVIIIEHDLAVLDYISDEIQIVYGTKAAYGIMVQPQAVRAGINEYLEGFISSANMRFREYKIDFKGTDQERETSDDVLLEYPDLKKSYDTFKVEISGATIHKGELLGIMGANGLGKTTFLKLLAGAEKPDDTKKLKIPIAYKPQYLSPVKGTVQEVLQAVSKIKLAKAWYKKNVIEKLGLDTVWELDVKHLSGGELQKLHIARTLLEDADVYAFDEPSAFIDVEDRIQTANIIKDFVITFEKCAVIVDHDVQFMDHVADAMLIFDGTPGKEGSVVGPIAKKEGMNTVLKQLNITYRKDPANGRARINKENSVLDREQKKKGAYYYS